MLTFQTRAINVSLHHPWNAQTVECCHAITTAKLTQDTAQPLAQKDRWTHYTRLVGLMQSSQIAPELAFLFNVLLLIFMYQSKSK